MITPRIIHVGLGPLGRRIAAGIEPRGIGRLVAAVDIDPELVGAPLSRLEVPAADAPPVLGSVDEVLEIEADAAIVATSSSLEACAATFRQLLGRGLAVVSTCEELCFPWLRHRPLALELDAHAREHGGRLLGTGVNPGFLMETLPATVTALCERVAAVHVLRRQDATSRREPFQRKIGAGLTPDAFRERVSDGTLRHVGLGESLHLLAAGLGWRIETWHETIDPVAAERDIASPIEIRAGEPAGVRQVATGSTDDGRTITLDFIAAVGQADPIDRITIEGSPRLVSEFPGGVHGDRATRAITLNALASLRAAPPGLHTMLTVPPVTCRAAEAADRGAHP